MPLNCNGVNSVSCVKSNRVVDRFQKRTFITNFEENFETETVGFRGFSKLPAVLVQRCDATLNPQKIISNKKKNKPTQKKNFASKTSVISEKILKCSVNVVKADLEKLKAALLKRPRDCDTAIKTNCNNITQDCSPVVVYDNNSRDSDLPAVRYGFKTELLDTPAIYSDKNISQKSNALAVMNNRNKSGNLNMSPVNIVENVFKNVSLTTKKKNNTRKLKKPAVCNNKNTLRKLDPLVHKVKNKSRKLDIPPVHKIKNRPRKLDVQPVLDKISQKLDIPIVLNGIKNLNLKNVDKPVVHEINTSDILDTSEDQDNNITETLNTKDIPHSLNTPKVHFRKRESQNLDIPIVLNGIKNLNLKNEDIPEVHSDISQPVNLDTAKNNDKYITENLNILTEHNGMTITAQPLDSPPVKDEINISQKLNTPIDYNCVKTLLNSDLLTVNPNFNTSVNLWKADLKKLSKALMSKKKQKRKKKRKHSHCPHRKKSKYKYHNNIFQYPDTPIIDSNGNISHFDTAIDSDINSPRDSDPVVDSQNCDILDSYLNLYQDYRSKINTVLNPFQDSHPLIIDSDSNIIQDSDTQIAENDLKNYQNSVTTSETDIKSYPNFVTPIVNSYLNPTGALDSVPDSKSIVKSAVNISQDCDTHFVNSDISISLNSVTPIIDSDLNISQYSPDMPIVGSDVNLSPYSDSSSYLDSDINISQYSHTPTVGSDIINISQYADTSLLEPDINFAQDAEGFIDSVMNIAQYCNTPTTDFITSRTSYVPLAHNDTDDSHDSDILMICASMNMVNLRCKICEKVYSNEKKLQYHEENKHMIVYKAKCNKPKKRVSFSDKVIIHEMTEYQKCRKCSKIFENYRSLKVHKKLKHKKRKCYVCDYCSKNFVDRMFFKVHIKLHCDVCGKLLRNKKKYVNHRKKVCRVFKLRKCKKCRRRFFKSMDLKDHNYEHESSCYVCDVCKDRFQTKCGLAHHIAFRHSNNRPTFLYTRRTLGTERLYLCNYCDESSEDRDLIEKHVQLLPDLDNRAMIGYNDYYFCDQCLKKFDTESDMLHHKWTHFLKTSDNSQVRLKTKNKNKKKKIKQTYKIYEKLPNYLQPTVVLEKLKDPVKVIAAPTVVDAKSCEPNKRDVKKPSVHPKPKKTIISKHQCQTCRRYFSSNYNLNRHIGTLHGTGTGTNNENLRCKICEEIFVWPSLLKSHKCIRLKLPKMPFQDARPGFLFDNIHEITPGFDDLSINESDDDYLNSVDYVPTPGFRQYESGYVSRGINGGIMTPSPSSSSSPSGNDGRYVPMHSLGYKVVMHEVPIEF